jgi:hypothetical protein
MPAPDRKIDRLTRAREVRLDGLRLTSLCLRCARRRPEARHPHRNWVLPVGMQVMQRSPDRRDNAGQ